MLNRHGLVADATGTGKTKTLQLIAEQLSAQGVPVFLADVKGDLSGISEPGAANDRIRSRTAEVHQQWTPAGFPAEFHALGGTGPGVPLRATVTSFGPLLLSKVLRLNRTHTELLAEQREEDLRLLPAEPGQLLQPPQQFPPAVDVPPDRLGIAVVVLDEVVAQLLDQLGHGPGQWCTAGSSDRSRAKVSGPKATISWASGRRCPCAGRSSPAP